MLYRFYIPELLFIFIISLLHICSISILMSSNINEVIRAVLNSFFFFTKRFCTHQKHQKRQEHKKHKKHQKTQKYNRAKAQNANKGTKIKNALKKHLSGKK